MAMLGTTGSNNSAGSHHRATKVANSKYVLSATDTYYAAKMAKTIGKIQQNFQTLALSGEETVQEEISKMESNSKIDVQQIVDASHKA